MRRDIFVLVVGLGRSGTSLCAGLLNSSYRLRVGYEISNRWLHSENVVPGNIPLFLKDAASHPEETISYKFNGNKVAIGYLSKFNFLKLFCENNIYILHDNYEKLKVIFTKRNSVNVIVSQYKRQVERHPNIDFREVMEDHIVSLKILKEAKAFFKDSYIFDFDKAIEDHSSIKPMFDYLGEEFHERYVSEYRGIGNYSHAQGIDKEFVLHGRVGKFTALRMEASKFLKEKGYTDNLDNWS